MEIDELLERDWTDLCYEAAWNWLIAVKDEPGWQFCHGSVVSLQNESGRIKHAWCENEVLVADLAQPVGHRLIELERYYTLLRPEGVRQYSKRESLVLSLKQGHFGPWSD
jgi:hypothetical protein